jgi:beta-mannosidase
MVLMPPSMPALLLLLVGWYTIGLTAATTRQQPATLLIRADGAAAPLPLSGASWTISSDTLSELGTLPATVPGDLISDLQRAGAVPDPWFETNFLDNRSVWNAPDWSYSRTFTGPAAAAFSVDGTAAAEAVLLVLDSVKMGAQVVLNGATVGETTDQFLRYEFDVTALLHRGGPNHLQLIFDSTIGTDGRFMACTGGW